MFVQRNGQSYLFIRRERMTIESSKNFGSALLIGVVSIFIIAIFTSLILSVVLQFSSLTEGSINYLVTAISFVSLFMGGLLAGRKRKENGWLIGLLTGLIFSFIVYLFQYLGLDTHFSAEQFIYHACFTLTAMMGGILGVNLAKN